MPAAEGVTSPVQIDIVLAELGPVSGVVKRHDELQILRKHNRKTRLLGIY